MSRCSLRVVAVVGVLYAGPAAADPHPSPTAWASGVPLRPFLILDAPARGLPGAAPLVRLHTRLTGPVVVATYRVTSSRSVLVARPGDAPVQVADTDVGAEAEALLVRTDPLPRRGAGLALVATATTQPSARPPTRPEDGEAEQEFAGIWGATWQPWLTRSVPIGALPSGLYLVRVLAGGWASSALVSVGTLTALVRRGDGTDRVVVTDAEGVPQRGVAVWRTAGGSVDGEGVTDARGEVTFPASEAFAVRYVAERDADVAWADVAHVRADACDVRVELVTGRPACRVGERLSVRGYVRGCDAGFDAPLAHEPVGVGLPEGVTTVATGDDGSFAAEVGCGGALVARVRGVEHRRTLRPFGEDYFAAHPAYLHFDRPWAAPGETVTGTVSDRDGGWPGYAQVQFSVGEVTGSAPIGRGYPAVFTFVMPPTSTPLERIAVRAEVRSITTTTVAVNELWTGTQRDRFDRPSAWTEAVTSRGAGPPVVAPRVPLEVTPDRAFVTPGETLGLVLRAPALGATLVTLERGDVWASSVIPAGVTRAGLPIPAGARGLATVVATHVHRGVVSTAGTAVEVETSRRFGLRVTTDALSYAAGARARVTVAARTPDGRAHGATVTLWVADAAWWELGADDHPPAALRMRGVERPAGAGDSTHPSGSGSDEGRRFDTVLDWNGRPLPGATFRHAWGFAGPTLRFDARATFAALATRIARAGGLRGATVCPAVARSLGRPHLRVQNVPWDLAALRVAEASGTVVALEGRTLNFGCPDGEGTIGMGNIGTMGHGSGTSASQGYGGRRRNIRRSIDGTTAFVASLPVDAAGEASFDFPLPAHPGRWRFEAFALGPDGGTATAHAIATAR